MALDRQEAKAEIQANNVPSVTNATMNVMLQQNILDNVLLRKDEKSSASGAGLSTYTANFANDEQVILTGINQNIAISFSNLEDGDVRYLYLTKGASNIVSFTGANDMTTYRYYYDVVATSVLYRVTSKNSLIFVEPITKPVEQTWNSLTLAGSWTGTAKYRINYKKGSVEFYFNISTTSTSDQSIGTLPSAYWPASRIVNKLVSTGGTLAAGNDNGGDPITAVRLSISNLNGAITIVTPNPLVLQIGSFAIYGEFEYLINTP